jgi:hypothetical protein
MKLTYVRYFDFFAILFDLKYTSALKAECEGGRV